MSQRPWVLCPPALRSPPQPASQVGGTKTRGEETKRGIEEVQTEKGEKGHNRGPLGNKGEKGNTGSESVMAWPWPWHTWPSPVRWSRQILNATPLLSVPATHQNIKLLLYRVPSLHWQILAHSQPAEWLCLPARLLSSTSMSLFRSLPLSLCHPSGPCNTWQLKQGFQI